MVDGLVKELFSLGVVWFGCIWQICPNSVIGWFDFFKCIFSFFLLLFTSWGSAVRERPSYASTLNNVNKNKLKLSVSYYAASYLGSSAVHSDAIYSGELISRMSF